MIPRHHLPMEWIVAEAAGTNEAPLSVLVAVHVTLCPQCRRQLDHAEKVAAGVLAEVEPIQPEPGDLEALLARLDEPVQAPLRDDRFPAPLAPFVNGGDWRRLAPRLHHIDLEISTPTGHPMRLLKMAAGAHLPHRDGGEERAVVLQGGWSDASGHYERGDVYHHLGLDHHDQRVDPGVDCIALLYNDAPVVLPPPLNHLFVI